MNQTMDSDNLTKVQRVPGGVLSSQLDALRRRHVGVLALTGLAILLVVSVELLALALFVDWWIELPWAVRLGSLIAQAALATYVLLTMVIAPLIRQPNEDELALMVERARPEFRSRPEIVIHGRTPRRVRPAWF